MRCKCYVLIAILLLVFWGCTSKEKQQHFSNAPTFPVAEWDSATEILMHTPGGELFNGVINPLAGLFEYYFDGELAAEEHQGYIKALEANGIKVHTVNEILKNAPIEDLRDYVKGILKYDASDIVEDNFAVSEEYRLQIINQMSRTDLISCILLQPTVKLQNTDNNTGVEAKYIQSPLYNLYFMRDQSITTPKGHIICNMNSSQRAAEVNLVEFCYNQLGIEPIFKITGDGRLEGGDYIPAGNCSFIGCGMRTNIEAINQIMQADGFGHDTIVVVNDYKWWQMQMHLDTYFNIIDKDLCTLVDSRYYAKEGDPEWVTVDVYARANSESEYLLIHDEMPFVEYLTSKGFDIITISEADELHYANNFLTIAPRHIMAVANQSKELEETFKKHNVTVEWIQLENLIKGYGAAHCMTQVLKRIPN